MMNPEDFLDKWFKVVPHKQQAALFADLKAVLTPPDDHIAVNPVISEVNGDLVIAVKCGPYAFEVSREQAMQLSVKFREAALKEDA